MVQNKIEDTDKAKNLQVAVNHPIALQMMEQLLLQVSSGLSLKLTHTTTLSKKKYPGNRHWHFKEDKMTKGCLDVTYWPDGALFWITMRNYEPSWVHRVGREMGALMTEKLTDLAIG